MIYTRCLAGHHTVPFHSLHHADWNRKNILISLKQISYMYMRDWFSRTPWDSYFSSLAPIPLTRFTLTSFNSVPWLRFTFVCPSKPINPIYLSWFFKWDMFRSLPHLNYWGSESNLMVDFIFVVSLACAFLAPWLELTLEDFHLPNCWWFLTIRFIIMQLYLLLIFSFMFPWI